MARPKADAATAWAPDDTNPRRHHRLAGLEPDNLLAFMALLGLLRALEEARPAWRPRAFWDVATHPWRPVLTLGEGQTEAAVAKAAAEGVKRLGASLEAICATANDEELQLLKEQVEELRRKPDLTEKEAKECRKKQKRLDAPRDPKKATIIARSANALKDQFAVQNPIQTAWVSALAGASLSKAGDWQASATPLMLTSGQQAFAGLIFMLCQEPDPARIARSLFRPWLYEHRGDSLRLSGAEARRYAYMASDPTAKMPRKTGETGDGVAPSEPGANILACLGFLSFPVFTLRHNVAIPAQRAQDNRDSLRLPIWTTRSGRGASLSGIEALIRQAVASHPVLPPEVLGWQDFEIFLLNEESATSKYKSTCASGFTPITPTQPSR